MVELGKLVNSYNGGRVKVIISELLNDVESVETYYKRNYDFNEILRELDYSMRPYNALESRIDIMLKFTQDVSR